MASSWNVARDGTMFALRTAVRLETVEPVYTSSRAKKSLLRLKLNVWATGLRNDHQTELGFVWRPVVIGSPGSLVAPRLWAATLTSVANTRVRLLKSSFGAAGMMARE